MNSSISQCLLLLKVYSFNIVCTRKHQLLVYNPSAIYCVMGWTVRSSLGFPLFSLFGIDL